MSPLLPPLDQLAPAHVFWRTIDTHTTSARQRYGRASRCARNAQVAMPISMTVRAAFAGSSASACEWPSAAMPTARLVTPHTRHTVVQIANDESEPGRITAGCVDSSNETVLKTSTVAQPYIALVVTVHPIRPPQSIARHTQLTTVELAASSPIKVVTTSRQHTSSEFVLGRGIGSAPPPPPPGKTPPVPPSSTSRSLRTDPSPHTTILVPSALQRSASLSSTMDEPRTSPPVSSPSIT